MSSIISALKGLIDSILEFDEIRVEPGPRPKTMRAIIVTTGIDKDLVKRKVIGWALGYQPAQIPLDIKVEEIQCGRLFCRYKVEVVMMSLKDWLYEKAKEKARDIEKMMPKIVRETIRELRPGIIEDIRREIDKILREPILLKKYKLVEEVEHWGE